MHRLVSSPTSHNKIGQSPPHGDDAHRFLHCGESSCTVPPVQKSYQPRNSGLVFPLLLVPSSRYKHQAPKYCLVILSSMPHNTNLIDVHRTAKNIVAIIVLQDTASLKISSAQSKAISHNKSKNRTTSTYTYLIPPNPSARLPHN